MPKVKCVICGETFDKNKEDTIELKNRYAHKNCYFHSDLGYKYQLESYIKSLFKIDKLSALITKQIKNYVENDHYSYASILATLRYFYEVKNGDLTKARGIGIVAYVYEEAFEYYTHLATIHDYNSNVAIPTFHQKQIEINSPQCRIKKKKIDLENI